MNQPQNTKNSENPPINLPSVLYPPRFRLGEIYLVDEFLANCSIAERTFAKWREKELRVHQPHTKAAFVLTDDVVSVWEKIASGK